MTSAESERAAVAGQDEEDGILRDKARAAAASAWDERSVPGARFDHLSFDAQKSLINSALAGIRAGLSDPDLATLRSRLEEERACPEAEIWRKHARSSLKWASEEVEQASEPLVIVVLTIGAADLLKEMPISVYANQTWGWLQRVMAFAAWRFSLKAADESPAGAHLKGQSDG